MIFGLRTRIYGVLVAICAFNEGFCSKVQIMDYLGLNPGKHLVIAMNRMEQIAGRKVKNHVEQMTEEKEISRLD